jgi:hypothetical protein
MLRTSEIVVCLLYKLNVANVVGLLRAVWPEAETCVSDLALTEHSDDKYV